MIIRGRGYVDAGEGRSGRLTPERREKASKVIVTANRSFIGIRGVLGRGRRGSGNVRGGG